MSSPIDKTEQIVIAVLEILLVLARNSRKIRKQLDKKAKPIKKQTTELETKTLNEQWIQNKQQWYVIPIYVLKSSVFSRIFFYNIFYAGDH